MPPWPTAERWAIDSDEEVGHLALTCLDSGTDSDAATCGETEETDLCRVNAPALGMLADKSDGIACIVDSVTVGQISCRIRNRGSQPNLY